MILLLLMLALQPTMGFSLLGDFLPFHPFLTQFSPPSYSHRLDVFLNIFYPFFLGLPLILLPIGFHSNIVLGILPPSIRITRPSQAIRLLFINLTMSAFPMSSFSLCFFLILQIPFLSCTGPKISLIFSARIFLIVVHFDLLMSRSHISMLLQVLLRLYIILVLNLNNFTLCLLYQKCSKQWLEGENKPSWSDYKVVEHLRKNWENLQAGILNAQKGIWKW